MRYKREAMTVTKYENADYINHGLNDNKYINSPVKRKL